MRLRQPVLIVVLVLLLGLTACGDGGAGEADGTTPSAGTGELSGLTADGEVGEALKVSFDGAIEAGEAVSEVLVEGEGNPVEANSTALLHLYIGNGTTQEQSVNTYEQGPAVSVPMSEDRLFKPVLDAIVGQNQGSRVAITASVEEVWGAAGQEQLGLKPEHTAVFVADIVSVEPVEVLDGPQGDEVDPPADAPKVVEKDGAVTGFDWSDAPKKAPKKLTVIPLVEGDGPEVEAESMVSFDYFGAVWGAKKPFDESYSREATAFPVGVGGLIKAWDEAIPGLTRGSRVLIIAPPDVAYGDQDQPNIPGGSTLVFVVDVLGVDA